MRKAASIIKMGAVLFVYALGSAFISQTAAVVVMACWAAA